VIVQRAAGPAGERTARENTTNMADDVDPQRLLTALTTEHFTLQGARAQTTSEATSRAALYIMAVSSTLIALGFIAQASEAGDLFNVFSLVVLPTLYIIGIFTFVRMSENSEEDVVYGRAINRIRHHYIELAGDQALLFMMTANDDPLGVLRNMGLTPSRTRPYLTAAYMIAVVNSVIGGSAVGLAIAATGDPPLWIPVAAGGVAAILSLFLMHRSEMARFRRLGGFQEVLFPSPERRAE
jgi:hypothetical protein